MAEVVIVRDVATGAELAADLISKVAAQKADAVLGLATGSSPLPVWKALAARSLDLGRLRGFALDEYIGLPMDHPASYRCVIRREIIEPLRLDAARVRLPGDDGGPLAGAGRRYEREIAEAGGIDLQVLGIGRNGHIGFNEPGSSLVSRTRVKTLAKQTRSDNARFFATPDEVPRHCLTQGLGTILEARHLVLLAFGEAKSVAIASAVEGPVSASLPASAIQLHPHVTVIADDAAASGLAHADYYRFAWNARLELEV